MTISVSGVEKKEVCLLFILLSLQSAALENYWNACTENQGSNIQPEENVDADDRGTF